MFSNLLYGSWFGWFSGRFGLVSGLVSGLVLGSVKTSGFVLGFQHFPRDNVNVNEWKSCLIPLLSVSIRSLDMH